MKNIDKELTTQDKEELKEMANILAQIQELPREKRTATQFYIKGTLQGLQIAGEMTTAYQG